MIEKIKFILFAFVILSFTSGCSNEEVNPIGNTLDPEKIDLNCGLKIVYRNNLASGIEYSSSFETGFGSDTLEYRNYADSSLINYTIYTYDNENKVILSQVYDINDVLESEKTTEYWPNGEKKREKRVRKKVETLYDKTNNAFEYSFDEKGKVVDYKTFDHTGDMIYHITYTNFYEGELLVKSIRDHIIDRFDAITEYTYNPDGTNKETIVRDLSGEMSSRSTYEYLEGQIILNSYSSDNSIPFSISKTYINKNNITLKTEILNGDGLTQVENFYIYDCSK